MTDLTNLLHSAVTLDAGALARAAGARRVALRARGRRGIAGSHREEARVRRFWSVVVGPWGSGEVWNGCTHPPSTCTDERERLGAWERP